MNDKNIVKRNDDNPRVVRPGQSGANGAFSGLRKPQSVESNSNKYKLSELLSDKKLADVLLTSNIFIFGKVGFLDTVLDALKSLYIRRKKESLETVRTQVEISNLPKGSASIPFILIPAAKNKEGVSEIVATAFETKRPIWLGALPSQIEKQILLSFDCFFISPGPALDNELADLIGLSEEHQKVVCNKENAILTIDHNFPQINKGKADNPGKVLYIQDLT